MRCQLVASYFRRHSNVKYALLLLLIEFHFVSLFQSVKISVFI